jgi:hypothetical protein
MVTRLGTVIAGSSMQVQFQQWFAFQHSNKNSRRNYQGIIPDKLSHQHNFALLFK